MKLAALPGSSQTAILASALVIGLAACAADTRPIAGPDMTLPYGLEAPTANVIHAQTVCTPGSVQACASVVLSLTPKPLGTLVQVRIRNMQGSQPLDNTGGSTIAFFTLSLNKPNWFPSNCPAFCTGFPLVAGNIVHYGHPDSIPSDQTFVDGPPTSTAFLNPWSNSHLSSGFFGCDVGPFPPDFDGNPVANAIGTCPAQGHTGYLEWRIQTTHKLKLADFGYRIDFKDLNLVGYGCTFRFFGTTCQIVP